MNVLKKTLSSAGVKMGKGSSYGSDQVFLHGRLDINIISAENLPDLEGWISKMVDKKDVTDPFVDVRLGKAKLAKTSVINNDLNPRWDESYRIEVCHFGNELIFEIRDKDHAYSEYIGCVEIPTAELLNGQIFEGPFDIKNKKGKTKGKLTIFVQFRSKQVIEKTYEVDCYYPMHNNCHVTLYQDAHCLPTSEMPQFVGMETPNQVPHQPRSCWNDLYDTLIEAKKLICITGWAVWAELHLFRGQDLNRDQRTLGEILIDKAAQGVKVYVMVWNEPIKGFMGTHDFETYNKFKSTKVHCALAPRELGSVNELTDALQNQFASGAYTHHQKSVICDADSVTPGGPRRLVAFVGGLDLTGGRYDTPNHELFKTLLNEHDNDFRNSNAKFLGPHQGPREPWHDIHSKVEGPVAYDVFLNFKERWQQQGIKEGELIPIESIGVDIHAMPACDPQNLWNCQFFRSITSDSAIFDPDRASHMNSKKGRQVDSSIAQAYIQMIRNAENFIYIENQYFLGSAYSWLKNDDCNCDHTIPMEITQRIIEKIYLNQRFTAYIMIPMFPEGDPASAPIQEILYWQTRTIEMMFKRIGDAIKETGSNTHPNDWLLFLCPGKREAPGEHLDVLEPADDEDKPDPSASKFRSTMRFPIYVHSKMMIVDDAYIIVGSANINQRSMAGTRDTEMAVGCWQPAFPENNPYGDVHVFRQSLWTEHFRISDPAFRYPGSQECIDKVKTMAWHNWQQYIAEGQGITTPGQCLWYPLDVSQNGDIKPFDGFSTFPDFGKSAKILGTVSVAIPQKVTT